jgi:hypothetical protein
MDHGQPLQWPARDRFLRMARDLGFGHAGIVLQRECGDIVAAFRAATDA